MSFKDKLFMFKKKDQKNNYQRLNQLEQYLGQQLKVAFGDDTRYSEYSGCLQNVTSSGVTIVLDRDKLPNNLLNSNYVLFQWDLNDRSLVKRMSIKYIDDINGNRIYSS